VKHVRERPYGRRQSDAYGIQEFNLDRKRIFLRRNVGVKEGGQKHEF
jgi:hypothetical protein